VLVQELVTGMLSATALIAQVDTRIDDPVWRAVTEMRSWRALRDQLAAEAPPVAFALAHPHALRFAAALAEAGNDYAAALAVGRRQRLVAANHKRLVAGALNAQMAQAYAPIVARLPA
jgi:hypothetical protein